MPQIVIGILFPSSYCNVLNDAIFFFVSGKRGGLVYAVHALVRSWPAKLSVLIWKAAICLARADWAPPPPAPLAPPRPTRPLPPFSSVNHPSQLSNEVSRTAYVWEVKGWKRGHHIFNREKKGKISSRQATEENPLVDLLWHVLTLIFVFVKKRGWHFCRFLPSVVFSVVSTTYSWTDGFVFSCFYLFFERLALKNVIDKNTQFVVKFLYCWVIETAVVLVVAWL